MQKPLTSRLPSAIIILPTVGSGGNFALAAARALRENTDLSAREIAEKALHIAADICVYTNHNVIVEEA